ncbi:hypothetical protein ACSQ67_018235 [Phaseolus vulgaris]
MNQRETLQREREREKRETERRYLDAGEELPLTLVGKSIFRFWFVTLQLNSIYSVPAFHCFWIESSTTLSQLIFSYVLLCFTLKLPQRKKVLYLRSGV